MKKRITITNAFREIFKESNRKPNKIWVDKGSKFYNRSMKLWLEKNDMEMYSTHNEGKSVVNERFIRTLKLKFIIKIEVYKYMTSKSKNVYIDKLEDTVNKYNNTYHSTIETKPVDVKRSTSIDSSKEIKMILNLKLVTLLEYQNKKTILQKSIFRKSMYICSYVISDRNGEKIVGMFYKKELQ